MNIRWQVKLNQLSKTYRRLEYRMKIVYEKAVSINSITSNYTAQNRSCNMENVPLARSGNDWLNDLTNYRDPGF